MRVRLIIRDKEYCRAMAEAIASKDMNILVEVVSDGNWGLMDDRTLIVTDIDHRRIESRLIDKYRDRIVFLTVNPDDALNTQEDRPYCIFKYRSVSNILADICQVNYLLTGETISTQSSTSLICVCSDGTGYSGSVAQSLARQILFHKGGNILTLSLNYLNEFGTDDETDNRKYSRLMYYLDIERDFPIEAFTYKDSYGITYMSLTRGLNPIAYMDQDKLPEFINVIGKGRFDVVVLNIGTCYSSNNLNVLNKASHVLFLSEDNSRLDIKDLIRDEKLREDVYRVHMGISGQDVELRIDDFVRRIYGISDTAN